MPKLPILLDGDPGHDDAIAWMLAAASPELEILCVTSVSGNQSIEKTTYNALRIMALLGIRAPMGRGCPRPLLSPVMTAPSVHGESGLDGPALPEPRQEPEGLAAPALMARVISAASEPVTLVPTGPLTNVAALLLAHPELKDRIGRISLMGGGIAHGNWTPAAEFNILADPEAADIVFRAGIPITMAGLDVTEQAMLFPEDFARIRSVGGPVAAVVADWLEFFYQFHRTMGYPGAPIHDAVAVAWLTHPELFSGRDMHVAVETAGRYCRGATLGDDRGIFGQKNNAHVLLDIDREGFARLLTQAVGHWRES